MERRVGKQFGRASAALIAVCGLPLPLAAQVSDGSAVKAISGSASVFTAATHTRTDRGNTTDTRTEPSVGVSGSLGGALASGANSLQLRYRGTLETRRDTGDGDQTNRSSILGAARYAYFDPAQPLDFNLGHSVTSVRNNTGFVVNPSSYDTRNTLSAGAGLRFNAGSLSTLRLFSQAGQSFGGGSLNDENSITTGAELTRRLSERSSASLNANRSWSDGNSVNQTIDSAQLVYQRQLENGSFSIGGGKSWATSEYSDNSENNSDALTGFADRSWVADQYRTSVQYNRRLSDSATDLSLNLPPEFDFLPETVQLRDLVVSDSLSASHSTDLLCDACTLNLAAEAALLKSQLSGDQTHEYRSSISLGVQLTDLQRISFGYSWLGDAQDEAGTIVDQIHRFDTRWSRQLAENTQFAVAFSQSYLRNDLGRDDRDQYVIRLELTHGFALTSR
ncbi:MULTISPECIES: hypothetical protein [unclassified Marinobacter]|uniref:hypothetical protein n=1 Tax=unclassified Marinobacter TaxID=83889 RepID=UPI00200F97D8|nr:MULTISPECIES: hypothetical protein [unclassified Marinobacter]UQG54176.1 hypothetical protein MIH16_11950 [Marinobacter sp. M4C]UQG62983.1 hypothetical protein MIH17_11955 [Marinobacter sp. M2C]UQG67261.1 hypothetical protein MIH19_11950 [Marinobacter sp. M1C]